LRLDGGGTTSKSVQKHSG